MDQDNDCVRGNGSLNEESNGKLYAHMILTGETTSKRLSLGHRNPDCVYDCVYLLDINLKTKFYMASQKIFILLSIFLSMVGTKALAYDITAKNADGIIIYYNYINDGKELEVTSGYYSGSVVIPEEVTYMNRTRKVTSIGNRAFYYCSDLTSVTIPNSVTSIGASAFYYCSYLTSVTIPNSVTSIGDYAFSNCRGLTSVTIGNGVTSIGESAFFGCDIPEVISNIEDPFTIATNTFSNNTFINATLYVPKGTVDKYKATEGWKKFAFIEEGDGSGKTQETQKCDKPTISYQNGKLTFQSATEGAVCHSTITDADIKSYSTNEVELGVTYNITVYATKTGYENSETATATLCWIDVAPKTEGITNGVATVRAMSVMIQNSDGQLTISGVDDGTPINVYNINGIQEGSSISRNGSAMVNTNLTIGSVAIVKIGDKSIKVVLK